MILEFGEHEYIDVEAIIALRWFPTKNRGIAVFNGERIALQHSDFQIVESAYNWVHKSHIYDRQLKPKKPEKKEVN